MGNITAKKIARWATGMILGFGLGFSAVVYIGGAYLQYYIATLPRFQSVLIESIENTVSSNQSRSIEDIIKKEGIIYAQAVLYGGRKGIEDTAAQLDKINYKQVIESVDHPILARKVILGYIKRNGLFPNGESHNFTDIHENKVKIDCSEAAMIAAATLSDDGYRPLLLAMAPSSEALASNKELGSHVVFLYKQYDKFGYIGANGMAGPIFGSIKDMLSSISENLDVEYTRFQIYDLNNESRDWIFSDKGLDKFSDFQPIKN